MMARRIVAARRRAAVGTEYTWLLKTTSSDAAYQMESAGATANWEAVYDADGTLIANAAGENPTFDLSGNTSNAVVAIRTADAITATAADVTDLWISNSLTSFDASALTNVTDCTGAWYDNNLTSFDASGLISVTTCLEAWLFNNLTSFDASALTNVTDCAGAWESNSLASFDASGLTSVTTCAYAWLFNNLISFDASALTNVTDCTYAWYNNNLTSFDASGFSTMGVPVADCFFDSWTGGTNALNAASVESILVNIDLSGQSAPAIGTDISISTDGSSLTSAAQTAVTNLKAKGWTPHIDGVYV